MNGGKSIQGVSTTETVY